MAEPYYLDEKERRAEVMARGEGWVGTDNIRVFLVASGDVATAFAASLLAGAVLPAKWGGVATSTAKDPRFQSWERGKARQDGRIEVITHWLSVD